MFDYINGFHDTANAIATSVATRALRPQVAVLMAAAFNFIGAFAGTAVAKTIGSGLVDDATTTQAIVAASLIGRHHLEPASRGGTRMPSSSSHALIGGLLGATIIAAGVGALNIAGHLDKVLIPMVTSPLFGLPGRVLLMVVIARLFHRTCRASRMAHRFRRLQVLSAGYMAFAHGSNDAQKTMGIITLALFAAGVIPTSDVPVVGDRRRRHGDLAGHRGRRLADHEDHGPPRRGAGAGPRVRRRDDRGDGAPGDAHSACRCRPRTSSPAPSWASAPAKGVRAVRWGVARNILVAWVVTLPAAGLVGAVAWLVIHTLGLVA